MPHTANAQENHSRCLTAPGLWFNPELTLLSVWHSPCSLCILLGFLQVLWFLTTSQKHSSRLIVVNLRKCVCAWCPAWRYSCLTAVPGVESGSTTTLTRIKSLFKMSFCPNALTGIVDICVSYKMLFHLLYTLNIPYTLLKSRNLNGSSACPSGGSFNSVSAR